MAMKMAGVTDCTIKSGKPPGLGVGGMIVQCTDDRVFAVLIKEPIASVCCATTR